MSHSRTTSKATSSSPGEEGADWVPVSPIVVFFLRFRVAVSLAGVAVSFVGGLVYWRWRTLVTRCAWLVAGDRCRGPVLGRRGLVLDCRTESDLRETGEEECERITETASD